MLITIKTSSNGSLHSINLPCSNKSKKLILSIFTLFVIAITIVVGQPNLSSPSVCSSYTSSDMTLTYNGSTSSCSYYTFDFTDDDDIINWDWEIWSSGKNTYNSYMNYCDVVNGDPADYTFSFKGWYLIRLIITFSDNSTCQVYKYLNVNGSNMINCQPNPSEIDVARPRVDINYSDVCYNSMSQIRGGLISFAGDPLAPCTDEAKISYYLNYIDCDGTTHCDVPIGYTQGYSSCFNISFNTAFIIEAVGNHCCYPDGFKLYKTIPYYKYSSMDTRPKAIIDNGNNCTDACTVWYSNCTTENWFYIDSCCAPTSWLNVSFPSSCSPYLLGGDNSIKKSNSERKNSLLLEDVFLNGKSINIGQSEAYEFVEAYDLLGRKINGNYNFSEGIFRLNENFNGIIILVVKSNGKTTVKKINSY
jgi:hypothetical protein